MNLKSYWPTLSWAIVIFCLHILPSDKIPKPPDWSISADKLVHFFLFAGLSFLVLMYHHHKHGGWNNRVLLVIILAVTLYGLLMETVQIAVPGREFNFVDLLADGLGAMFGCIAGVMLVKTE